MKITWTIENFEREIATGLVTTIHWRVFAEDQGRSYSHYGSENIRGDASAPGFVPFAEITESMAMTWLHDRFREKKMLDPSQPSIEQIEDFVKQSLTQSMTPKYKMGTPWR
jgi:hypothetical protein